MRLRSFPHILLSLAFIVLTTTLVTHHHTHEHSSEFESECSICFVAGTSVIDGYLPIVNIEVRAAESEFIFISAAVPSTQVIILKARDPPDLLALAI